MKKNKGIKIIGIWIVGVLIGISGWPYVQQCTGLPATNVVPLLDEQYFQSVHKALKDAKKSIFCVMFMAKINPKYNSSTEYILVKDLINAHKRGVEVMVIFDQNIRFWGKKRWDNQIERKSKDAYEMLLKAGVPVYYDDKAKVTHSKVIVIDDIITIVGSTNWTYNGLNKNHEASVLIESKEVAEEFTRRLRMIPRVKVME